MWVRRSVNQLDSARKMTCGEARSHDAALLARCQPAITSLFFRLLMPILVFIIMLSFFTFLFPYLFLSTSAFEFSTGNVEKSIFPSLSRSASTSPLASPTSSPSETSAPISFLADIHLAGTSHPTFGGFLEPIDQNRSSLFKLGSTIPIKFKLKWPDGQQQSADINAQIFTAKVSDRVMSSEVETNIQKTDDAAGSIASRGERVNEPVLPTPDAPAVSEGTTDKPTPGNNFLHDPLTNEFVFNLGTKDLTPGTWQIEIILDDGRSHTANVSLVK